jgi:hypothetical protein
MIEVIKNEMMRRAEMQDGEMRIGAETDPKKGNAYLFYAMKKMQWPKI